MQVSQTDSVLVWAAHVLQLGWGRTIRHRTCGVAWTYGHPNYDEYTNSEYEDNWWRYLRCFRVAGGLLDGYCPGQIRRSVYDESSKECHDRVWVARLDAHDAAGQLSEGTRWTRMTLSRVGYVIEMPWYTQIQRVRQRNQHPNEFNCTTQHAIVFPSGETVCYITSRAAVGGSNPVQSLIEAGTKLKLEWLWTHDIGATHRDEDKSKKKDSAMNHDAEAVSYHCQRKDHRSRRSEGPQGDKDRKVTNADTWLGCFSPYAEGTDHETNEVSDLTAGTSGTLSPVPSRVNTIELDDWTLAVNIDEHGRAVGSVERTEMDSGTVASVCSSRCATEIPMPNHARRGMLQTASGAQIQRADQKTIRYDNGDDTLVSIKFKAAVAIIPSDAFGELEERGMTVAMDPHDFETGNQTTKLAGKNLSSKQPNDAYWMSLTRWEDDVKTVAPVDLGVVAMEDAEANVPTRVTNPKESGGVKRPRHERTRVAHMNRCSKCVAGRGTCDSHHKWDSCSGSRGVGCDYMPLLSRVQLASPGWIIFNTTEMESQTTTMVTAKAASDTLVRFSLAMLYVWGRSDAKSLLRPDQDVTLNLIRRKYRQDANTDLVWSVRRKRVTRPLVPWSKQNTGRDIAHTKARDWDESGR